MEIIFALLLLCLLITFHEYGHYYIGKLNGIRANKFAIGFGPRLFKWYRDGTEFSFRPILIGGFVEFVGEEDYEDQDDTTLPLKGSFNAASVKARLLTILAGPVANILIAWVLAVILLCGSGVFGQTVISSIEPNSLAQEAGLQVGDVIKSLDGQELNFYALDRSAWVPNSESTSLVLDRDGQLIDITIAKNGQDLIGIETSSQPYDFFTALGMSFRWLWEQTVMIFKTLGGLFTGVVKVSDMSGIVGVTAVTGQAIQTGSWEIVFALLALVSLNLGIFNLLPLPLLDGGKAIQFSIEGVTKKSVNTKLIEKLTIATAIILLAFMGYLVFIDITRLMV